MTSTEITKKYVMNHQGSLILITSKALVIVFESRIWAIDVANNFFPLSSNGNGNATVLTCLQIESTKLS